MLTTIIGDLTTASEKYIVHQTNCLSHFAGGIAAVLFNKFPYSNVYANRMEADIPGEIIICGDGIKDRYIVNLMGQYYPGGISDEVIDNETARQKYFYQGLLKLAKVENLESVAFPFRCGCGIAGGDWNWYKGTITNFANYIYKSQGAKTFIYQREEDL